MKRDCQCPRANHQHGTRGAYQQDECRCFPCRVANSRAKATWKAGDTYHEAELLTVGVQRRLQALNAIGWTWQALGERLGTSRQAVYSMAGGKKRTCVLIHTARRVAALYDELWDQHPEGVPANRARIAAARKGYRPPLFWDDDSIDLPGIDHKDINQDGDDVIDEIALERALAGHRVRLNRAEMSAAHARLNAQGLSAREISERLGITARTVVRRRTGGRAA